MISTPQIQPTNVTIVSGFISNANNRDFHKSGEYLRNGKLFLKSTTPKIVFLDEEMFSQIQETDYNSENTRLVLYNKMQAYYMKYIDDITTIPATDNPTKDSKEFLLTMWNKTEYMREAAQLNLFNTDYYVWIDFGIRYVCKNSSDQEFIQKLNNIKQPESHLHDKVRIGGIWNLNHIYHCDLIQKITWYFAGGVFGGRKDVLIWFSEEMRKECEDLVMTYHTATWEVNIWYIILHKFPYMFDIYPSSHNETLIDGYGSSEPLTTFI